MKFYTLHVGKWVKNGFKPAAELKYIDVANFVTSQPKWESFCYRDFKENQDGE